jgi:nitrite reductase (NADH) small subunit
VAGARWVRVAKVADLRPDRGLVVRAEGTRIALFRVAGKLHAMADACPHMGTSLAEGRILKDRVICRWHGWSFDLATGQGGDGARPWACARVYPIEARGDELYVELPEEPAVPPVPPDDPWVPWADDFIKSKPEEPPPVPPPAKTRRS